MVVHTCVECGSETCREWIDFDVQDNSSNLILVDVRKCTKCGQKTKTTYEADWTDVYIDSDITYEKAVVM